MIERTVRVHPSSSPLACEDQLAWKIAAVAENRAVLDPATAQMACCRILDNAAVAFAALDRAPVVAARAQAVAHPRSGGATLFGLDSKTRVRWPASVRCCACLSKWFTRLRLWHKVRTVDDPLWSRRYLDADPAKRAFGGRLEVIMEDGSVVQAEKAVADAHPNGATPWVWDDYVNKWQSLCERLASAGESERFIAAVQALAASDATAVRALLPVADLKTVAASAPTGQGIFDHPG